jgi:hypothetical protein
MKGKRGEKERTNDRDRRREVGILVGERNLQWRWRILEKGSNYRKYGAEQ